MSKHRDDIVLKDIINAAQLIAALLLCGCYLPRHTTPPPETPTPAVEILQAPLLLPPEAFQAIFPTPASPSGTSFDPAQCEQVFAEDFEGSTTQMGRSSFANPETVVWYVDDLSAYASPIGPAACAQGSFCAITVDGEHGYGDNEEDLLFTPEIDFTSLPGPAWLSFDLAYNVEFSGGVAYDGLRILVTPDLGENWYLVEPLGGYPFAYVEAFGTAGYSADQDWKTQVVDMGPMIAAAPTWVIAFEFASDASISGGMAAIDNIQVFANCSLPLEVDLPFFHLEVNANCYHGPWPESGVATFGLAGERYHIEGRNADLSWFQVRFNENLLCWMGSESGKIYYNHTGEPCDTSDPIGGDCQDDLWAIPMVVSPPTLTPVACSSHLDQASCSADPACTWIPGAGRPGYCKHK
jgi:hypothetical protein